MRAHIASFSALMFYPGVEPYDPIPLSYHPYYGAGSSVTTDEWFPTPDFAEGISRVALLEADRHCSGQWHRIGHCMSPKNELSLLEPHMENNQGKRDRIACRSPTFSILACAVVSLCQRRDEGPGVADISCSYRTPGVASCPRAEHVPNYQYYCMYSAKCHGMSSWTQQPVTDNPLLWMVKRYEGNTVVARLQAAWAANDYSVQDCVDHEVYKMIGRHGTSMVTRGIVAADALDAFGCAGKRLLRVCYVCCHNSTCGRCFSTPTWPACTRTYPVRYCCTFLMRPCCSVSTWCKRPILVIGVACRDRLYNGCDWHRAGFVRACVRLIRACVRFFAQS